MKRSDLFQRTFDNLVQCEIQLDSEDLDKGEQRFRLRVIRMCREIAEEGELLLEEADWDTLEPHEE